MCVQLERIKQSNLSYSGYYSSKIWANLQNNRLSHILIKGKRT